MNLTQVIDEPQVTLLEITPHAEELIERAGRVCYDTAPGSSPDRIARWIRSGHESVIEHAVATFEIVGSRVLTHELVRHRLASYSQRSQRYVKEAEPQYFRPPELLPEGDAASEAGPPAGSAAEVYAQAMDAAWAAYQALLDQGVPKQIARYVLPNACLTRIVVTANFREWRTILKLRASKRAQPEFQVAARRILAILLEKAPQVFGDLRPLLGEELRVES